MSYFTDDTIDDSATEPLIVDPKNMPSERLDFGQHVYQRGKQIFATDHLLSPLINADDAADERRKLIEEHAGENLDDIVKQNGFDPGFGAPGDETYEDAIEQYKQTLPNELKAKIFTREGLKHRAKELGRKKHDDANKKLERSSHGMFADLVGGLGAYSADPLFLATQVLAPEIAFARLAAKGVQLSQKGRIGARAGIDAVAGAGYEIPLQLGAVQPYKNELGIKHDNADVANSVFLATVLGGAFGGVFEGLAGAFRKVKTGEWTPQQAKEFLGKNYDKLPPEQKEMVDMSIQAMDHELSNPYGPSPEGRARHNKETAEEYKRLDTFERPLTETDIKANKEFLERAQSPEELEFQELRAEAIREAGILGTARQAEATAQQIEANPLEAQIKSLTDGLELGDELAVGTLARVGLDEAQAREVLAYAVRSGIITKDADGKITLAKRVDDPDNPVVKGDSKEELLEAEIDELKAKARISYSLKELKKIDPSAPKDLERLFTDAERILPKDVKRQFLGELDGAYGSFDSQSKLLKVAMDSPNIGLTLRHEALHALRSRFKTKEWKTLVEASGKIDFPSGPAYLDRISKTYSDHKLSDLMIVDNFKEERVANLIEYAYKGGDISALEPKPRNMIEKIVEWIKALAATLKSPKHNKLRNILEDFESGKIAEREPRKLIPYTKEAQYQLGDVNPKNDFTINIDGEDLTPEQLIKSADNDIAQAENLKLCVLMGGR